jgi:hypothetical protein
MALVKYIETPTRIGDLNKLRESGVSDIAADALAYFPCSGAFHEKCVLLPEDLMTSAALFITW